MRRNSCQKNAVLVRAPARTPLHCAASCNNVEMVKLLVQNGACLFAMTFSDRQIPTEKCNRQIAGYDDCNKYLSGEKILPS